MRGSPTPALDPTRRVSNDLLIRTRFVAAFRVDHMTEPKTIAERKTLINLSDVSNQFGDWSPSIDDVERSAFW